MNDPAVRSLLIPSLRASRPDALIVQEWGTVVNYGRPDAGTLIIDVAAIGADLVEAWEIKSGVDSLARLPRQVPLYSALFDRCTVVTSRSHIAAATRLLCGPLTWWGLVLVEGERLETARPAAANPGPYSTTGLLWRAEAAKIARQVHAPVEAVRKRCSCCKPSATKGTMLDALAQAPREMTAPLVCAALTARADWRRADGYRVERRA